MNIQFQEILTVSYFSVSQCSFKKLPIHPVIQSFKHIRFVTKSTLAFHLII